MAIDNSAEEPLLAPVAEEDQQPDVAPKDKINMKAVALTFLYVLVSDIGYFVSITPMTRVFEDITCRRYFEDSGQTLFLVNGTNGGGGGRPDETQCKIPEVQGPVAELFGYQTFFDSLVGIALGLYFGALADRVGRRPVFILGTVGAFLSSCWTLYICWMEFPLRYAWLSSTFLVLGGGSTVVNACLTMIITDATPAATRSRVFLYFTASNLGSEVVAPPIASYFIDSNPWVPLLIGLCCTASTVLIAASLPETLALPKLNSGKTGDEEEEEEEADNSSEEDGPKRAAKETSFKSTMKHTLQSLRYIKSRHALFLLVCVFMISDFARQSMLFLVQYVSVRYRLTLGKANYLLSWRATAAIIVNTTILPAADTLMQSRLGMSPQNKDLTLARMSICLFTAGFLVLAVAPTVAIVIFGIGLYTLGGAFGTFMRSMISTMVEPHRFGSIYSTLSIMDTAGALVAGPILAQALKWSISLGHGWSGLPYMFASVLCGVGAVVLFVSRPF